MPRVLLLKRTIEARFMPGAWVFPGGAVEPGDGSGDFGVRACGRRELHEETGISLDPNDEMVLFSRWTTPDVVPIRFDATFFLAESPIGAVPRTDGTEIVDAEWFSPAEALTAYREGHLVLAFPTVHQLTELSVFAANDDVLEAYRRRTVIPILPKVVVDGDHVSISLDDV